MQDARGVEAERRLSAYFVMVAYFYGWQVYSNIYTVMSISATIGDMKLRQENPYMYKDALYLVTGIGLAESGIMCKCAPSLVDVSEEYEIRLGIYELCQACLTAIRLCVSELRVAIVSLVCTACAEILDIIGYDTSRPETAPESLTSASAFFTLSVNPAARASLLAKIALILSAGPIIICEGLPQ